MRNGTESSGRHAWSGGGAAVGDGLLLVLGLVGEEVAAAVDLVLGLVQVVLDQTEQRRRRAQQPLGDGDV